MERGEKRRKEEKKKIRKGGGRMKTDRNAGMQKQLAELLKMTKDNKGNDVYAHVRKIIMHCGLANPKRALEDFEEISHTLRAKDSLEPGLFLDHRAHALGLLPYHTALYKNYFEVRLRDQVAGEKAKPG